MNCMSMDSIIELFYHLNKMLIATKHMQSSDTAFEWMTLFLNYRIFSGSAKALVRCGGKL